MTREVEGETALGFLTALAHRKHGTFGGLLVLNAQARPLEFHCTAPIKPNRAQEILYGPTLESYLYTELIAKTLHAQISCRLSAVCTDRPAMLELREAIDEPVLLLAKGEPGADDAERSPAEDNVIQAGNHWLQWHPQFPGDEAPVRDLVPTFDLSEPFNRIREAIKEAQFSQSQRTDAV